MGVGKTTVSKLLCKQLPKCVYLDGDWCWCMDPFVVCDETKALVVDNICHTLNNFIKCSVFENVVFAWVLNEQSIIDGIVSHLDTDDLNIISVSLVVSESELKARLQNDIDAGLRSSDVIGRSISRLSLYENLNTIKIDTDNLTVEQVVQKIIDIGQIS